MRLISCHVSKTLYSSEAALYKVSIELPVANRHRDLTEKMLKATLTKTKTNQQKHLKESRTCVQKRWTYQIPFHSSKASEKRRFSLTAVHAFVGWEISMPCARAPCYTCISVYDRSMVKTVFTL